MAAGISHELKQRHQRYRAQCPVVEPTCSGASQTLGVRHLPLRRNRHPKRAGSQSTAKSAAREKSCNAKLPLAESAVRRLAQIDLPDDALTDAVQSSPAKSRAYPGDLGNRRRLSRRLDCRPPSGSCRRIGQNTGRPHSSA